MCYITAVVRKDNDLFQQESRIKFISSDLVIIGFL